MAKSTKPNAGRLPEEGSELIVVVQPDANLRSAGKSVSSGGNRKVAGLNSILSKSDASFTPLFQSLGRRRLMSGASTEAFENAGITPGSFYKIDTADNLNKVAEAMLNDGIVEAAYIKPPSEPPVIIDEHMAPPDLSEDAPPVTPSFIGRQLYLEAAPGGINARHAWLYAGGKGNNVRIIDIEGAWRYSHEDLVAVQGGVIGGTQSTDIRWRDHGTAVIGVFGGDENAIGVTGICPNANSRAISIFGTGQSSSKAIVDAANALSAGDIILLELHRPGPRHNFAGRDDQLGYIAIEWWPDDYAAILYATSRNILVVEAAGNGAENLNDAIYNTRPAGFPASWRNPFNTANPTSNAIVVGAGAPPPGTHGADHGPDRSRLDFSNFGNRVDCQGWGREVTTCGYGDLQGGGNEDFWYTNRFSGTSSASPVVVGALGCIQGRLKNRSKPLLTPASARNLLRTTGSPQQDAPGRPASQRIGNRPDLKQIFNTLNIGGLLKHVKEKEAKEFKEKEVKEFKDKEKEFKEKEVKEAKEKETKEFEKVKDLRDVNVKHTKEFEKVKDVREGVGGLGGQVVQPQSDPSSLEGRLQNLEFLVNQMAHFISSENRPDLESNLFQDDPYSNAVELQKNAADAKNAKDMEAF
jgi:hypothetical protein